ECDIADGTSDDANGNGVPDECDPDCNNNGVPDDLDIAQGTSQDCNNNDIPDECDIADGTSNDVNGNSVPDECEPDCNGNGIPDDWDITQGTSQDCQPNGIPDECDIADGTSPDCDGNGVPDECDDPTFCEDGRIKPRALTMRYTGEDCSATSHSQDPCEVFCDGDPAFASPVRVVANNKPTPFHHQALTWFDGTVELDSTFTADATNAGEVRLKGSTWVHILDPSDAVLQTVQFHTSCSQPLNYGDQFGSVLLLAFVPEDCDDLCRDDARPQVLTMEYTGEDCGATHHFQDPSLVICNGDPASATPVRILSSNDPDPFNPGAIVWFDGTVDLNTVFDIDATNGGMSRLTGETWVHILTASDVVLQSVRFHTSCSQPLHLGDQFGSVVLIGFVRE
ncbi:MAG: hypothetical protein KKI02_10540, partial [Planctomycetes bacterium]|nr:hypothetical protein [Planctomycetota bacterium]